MSTFRIKVNGKEQEIEATRQGDRIHVKLNGRTVDLHLLHTDGAHFVLEWEQPDGTRQRIRAAGLTEGDKRHLWVNGRAFSYERVRRQPSTAVVDHNSSLSASIPAVVTEVLIKVGEMVRAGDKLILLESMKMVIPIQSPCDGKVIRINCAQGDAVGSGEQLVEIEECEAS